MLGGRLTDSAPDKGEHEGGVSGDLGRDLEFEKARCCSAYTSAWVSNVALYLLSARAVGVIASYPDQR